MAYDVVLADPPWSYYKSNHTNQARNHYKTMSRQELIDFDWHRFIDKGILFMWTTSPKLAETIMLGRKIGLHYRGISFVWVKTGKSGKPLGAMGVRPSIVKPTTELVLAFSKVTRGRPLPLSDESIVQTVFAPISRHSEKPEEVQDRLELMYPNATKCELFARRRRPGWDCYGDELEIV